MKTWLRETRSPASLTIKERWCRDDAASALDRRDNDVVQLISVILTILMDTVRRKGESNEDVEVTSVLAWKTSSRESFHYKIRPLRHFYLWSGGGCDVSLDGPRASKVIELGDDGMCYK